MNEGLKQRGIQAFGSKERFDAWLNSSPRAAAGKKIKELPEKEIEKILGRVEYGVYS